MTRRACLSVLSGLLAAPRSLPCRASILVLGLTASGCVTRDSRPASQFPLVELAFVLFVAALFILCTGFIVLVAPRRRRRKVAKMLVAFSAGSVCGAIWVLLVDTVTNAADFDALDEPAVLVVGLVATLVAAFLLSTPDSLTEVTGLSAMAIGLHSLALPLAALISFRRSGGAMASHYECPPAAGCGDPGRQVRRGPSHDRPQRRRIARGVVFCFRWGSSAPSSQGAAFPTKVSSRPTRGLRLRFSLRRYPSYYGQVTGRWGYRLR